MGCQRPEGMGQVGTCLLEATSLYVKLPVRRPRCFHTFDSSEHEGPSLFQPEGQRTAGPQSVCGCGDRGHTRHLKGDFLLGRLRGYEGGGICSRTWMLGTEASQRSCSLASSTISSVIGHGGLRAKADLSCKTRNACLHGQRPRAALRPVSTPR